MKGSNLCRWLSCLGERCLLSHYRHRHQRCPAGCRGRAGESRGAAGAQRLHDCFADRWPAHFWWVNATLSPPSLGAFYLFHLHPNIDRPSLCFRRALKYAGWATAGSGEGDYERALLRASGSDGRACLPVTAHPLAGNCFAAYRWLPSL